jgi:hypothetical protein
VSLIKLIQFSDAQFIAIKVVVINLVHFSNCHSNTRPEIDLSKDCLGFKVVGSVPCVQFSNGPELKCSLNVPIPDFQILEMFVQTKNNTKLNQFI